MRPDQLFGRVPSSGPRQFVSISSLLRPPSKRRQSAQAQQRQGGRLGDGVSAARHGRVAEATGRVAVMVGQDGQVVDVHGLVGVEVGVGPIPVARQFVVVGQGRQVEDVDRAVAVRVPREVARFDDQRDRQVVV